MMKKRLLFYGSAVFLSAILGLSACAGSSKSVQTTAAMPAADYEAMDSAETAGERAMEEQAGLELDASKTGMTDTTSLGQALPSNRKLIRSVDLSLETDAFDQLLKTLTDKIGELGGYVEQSDISGNSLNYRNELTPRYASLKVRIPIDRLDGFISVVEANGNITNKSETTQDVTVQYSDLESRKKSLTVEQERIWALLEKADTLESVIALEERLSEIRYQLESMESQLRLYDNQVDYSTVELHISEVQSLTPTAPDNLGTRISKGFDRSLSRLADNTISLFVWVVSNSPYLILLAAAWMIVRRFLQNNGSGREHRGGWFGRKFKKQNKNSDDQKNATIDNNSK